MVTIKKITYIVGISIAISMFVLFLYYAVPNMIVYDHWKDLDRLLADEEYLLAEFTATPAYIAFYDRYPNATETVHTDRRGGDLQVGVANIEKGNFLKLSLYYTPYDDRINVNVLCETPNREDINANGVFAVDFIKETDCLNLETLVDTKDTTTVLPNVLNQVD